MTSRNADDGAERVHTRQLREAKSLIPQGRREAVARIIDPEAMAIIDETGLQAGWFHNRKTEALAKADAIEALYASLPEGAAGAAEREVGRAVYERIERLIGAFPNTPEARELEYLAHLAESVEEVGGYDGPAKPLYAVSGGEAEPVAWREALEPFAKIAASYPDLADDDFCGGIQMRTYRAAQAALSASTPQGDWLPIEGAGEWKDGRTVQLWFPGLPGCEVQIGFARSDEYAGQLIFEWRDRDNGEPFETAAGVVLPTHYRPLPPPPVGDGKD